MWKRLPLRDRGNKGRQSIQIGQPTLVESTYDVAQLDRAQDLSPIDETLTSPSATSPLSPGEAYYNAGIRPSRARQDMEDRPPQQIKIPTMNFGKRNPNDPTSYRPSVAASSVYSQPDEDRISPPSSPYSRPRYDDGQISPIEEQSPASYGELRPAKSQIPVPRKITPKSKEWTQNVGKGAPMMWDDYSGEPTFDGAGKASTVKPGEFDYKAKLKPVNKISQPVLSSNDAQKTSLKEKASRLAKQGLAVDTRPPWKGGSGRHAIVDAPQDKPGQIVPKPRRTEEKPLKSPENYSSNGNPSSGVAVSPETSRVAHPYENDFQSKSHARPAADHSITNAPRSYEIRSGGELSDDSPNDYPDLGTDRAETPTNGHPDQLNVHENPSSIGVHPAHRDNYSQPSYVDGPPRKPEDTSFSKKTYESPNPNLDSRFSWTTTATSTYQRSIPPSPPPPMPSKYLNGYPSGEGDFDSPASTKPSILDRTHPTRRLGAESPPASSRSFSAGSTLRKPVSTLAVSQGSRIEEAETDLTQVQPPSPEPEVIKQQFPMTDWRTRDGKKRASSLAPSVLSNSSSQNGKTLPKTPQELSSPDLIASLQAQQDDLALQRRNIERVIADLEKPEAKNPVLHSFKVIREREKQLETLKMELADVGRREHDLGMRLHRAWKRKERDDPNTPGSIFWVRRATAGT